MSPLSSRSAHELVILPCCASYQSADNLERDPTAKPTQELRLGFGWPDRGEGENLTVTSPVCGDFEDEQFGSVFYPE